MSLPDAFVPELVALLASHNRKEEHLLYPRGDQHLSAAHRAALVAELKHV